MHSPLMMLAEEMGVDPSTKRLAKKVSRKIAASPIERKGDFLRGHFARARAKWAYGQVSSLTQWKVRALRRGGNLRQEIEREIERAQENDREFRREERAWEEKRAWEEHLRVERAADMLKWEHIGYVETLGAVEHQEAEWLYLGEGKPRSLVSDLGYLFVKDRNLWFDVGGLGLTKKEGRAISGWLLLANRHHFYLAGRMARGPEKAYEWLLARKPSRKGLEKKFRKFIESLPCDHDWSDRQPNEVLAHLGAWHCQNEREMMEVGQRNGWCFGAEYHALYVRRLNQGAQLWFLQTERGLISAFKSGDGPEDPWAEVRLPHNEDAEDFLAVLERQAAEELKEKADGGRYWKEAEQYWAATGY